jgi:uncharacterized protein
MPPPPAAKYVVPANAVQLPVASTKAQLQARRNEYHGRAPRCVGLAVTTGLRCKLHTIKNCEACFRHKTQLAPAAPPRARSPSPPPRARTPSPPPVPQPPQKRRIQPTIIAPPPASTKKPTVQQQINNHGYKIEVKTSNIAGAGKGAFTTVDIPKGTKIGMYHGRVTHRNADGELNDHRGYYNLNVGRNKTVDATDERFSDWTRFINDPRGSGKRGNLMFLDSGKIETSRKIHAGEELYISYGRGYWGKNSFDEPHRPYGPGPISMRDVT